MTLRAFALLIAALVSALPFGSYAQDAARPLLAWTVARLPAGFAPSVARIEGVTRVTVVASGNLLLAQSFDRAGALVDAPRPGYFIPLEAMAIDAETYPAFVPEDAAGLLASLAADEAVLGETSARLRRLGAGGRFELADGTSLTVRAVVPDALIGGGELAVVRSSWSRRAVPDERYLLIDYEGERARLEAAVRALLPPETAIRFRTPGETPILRHSDAVLPQARIKERFGEFALHPGPGGGFTRDPEWEARNLVTIELPLLGAIHCHRLLVPVLAAAMRELIARGLGGLIETKAYRGCDSARMIANGSGLSRHAWGAALDLNFHAGPAATAKARDPRLIEVMDHWGLTSGHPWLVPDPGHFEYIRPPAAPPP